MAQHIGPFLQRRVRGVHPVADGWTATNSDSVLGLLAVYEEQGDKHTGAVLAQEVYQCTERFDLRVGPRDSFRQRCQLRHAGQGVQALEQNLLREDNEGALFCAHHTAGRVRLLRGW